MRLNVQMEEYYKLLSYQVEKSRCASDFTLDKIRICIFCNASHLMNKILYTLFCFNVIINIKMSQKETSPIGQNCLILKIYPTIVFYTNFQIHHLEVLEQYLPDIFYLSNV